MKHEDCKVGMKCKVPNHKDDRYVIITNVNPPNRCKGAVNVEYFAADGTPWCPDTEWGVMADILEPFDECIQGKCDAELCPDCGVAPEWCAMALKCPKCWRVF